MLRASIPCVTAIATLLLFVTTQSRRPAVGPVAPAPSPVPEADRAPVAPSRVSRLSPRERTQIAVPDQNPIELYPPSDGRAARPLTFVLHGRDMDPSDMCERWIDAGRADAWLACPAGNTTGDETFDWSGTAGDRLAALDAQLGAVDAVLGQGGAREEGDVVVGFSRGAFLARDLVLARPGRFRGVVLLGAAISVSPERLKEAGVRRVVLGCGDKDEARASMTRTASKLAANGVATRFVSLGPIYHVLPAGLGSTLRDALAWARTE